MQQKWGSSWRCQRMGGVPTTDPAIGMVIPRIWQLGWTGRGPRAGVPVASRGFVMQKLFCCEARVGGGIVRGLCQPPKGGGSSQTRATSTAFTAKFGAAEMLCLSLPTCICVRARIIYASLGWNACSRRDVWAPTEVRGAAGTPHLQTQAPWQKGSTQELASGIFFFNQISLKLSLARSIPCPGGRRGACQGIARVSLQKAAAPEQN